MGISERKGRAAAVGAYVACQINYLQRGLFGSGAGASAARAELARLRRLGATDDSAWMLVGNRLFGEWPEEKLGQPIWDGRPTRELLAVQAALRFYGLHQQSQKKPMAMDGRGVERGKYNGAFGWACRRIEPNRESLGGVQRRLACIENAVDFAGVIHQIQGLIPQIGRAGIPLDYCTLASDLYLLQIEAARDGVIARWAKDYYLYHPAEEDSSSQPAVNATH